MFSIFRISGVRISGLSGHHPQCLLDRDIARHRLVQGVFPERDHPLFDGLLLDVLVGFSGNDHLLDGGRQFQDLEKADTPFVASLVALVTTVRLVKKRIGRVDPDLGLDQIIVGLRNLVLLAAIVADLS